MERNQSGFRESSGLTLIELTIASGILAIAFVMLMGGIVSINSTNAVSESSAVASAQLASIVDEVQSLPYQQLLAYQPPALRGLGASSRLLVTCIDSGGNQVNLPVSPTSLASPLPNPLEVQITALWNDKQGRLYTSRVSTFCRR